jgi:hypothetical protein
MVVLVQRDDRGAILGRAFTPSKLFGLGDRASYDEFGCGEDVV